MSFQRPGTYIASFGGLAIFCRFSFAGIPWTLSLIFEIEIVYSQVGPLNQWCFAIMLS